MTQSLPPFALGSLDRDAETRLDPQLLAAAWRDPSARLVRLRGTEIPVTANGELVLLATSGDYTAESEATPTAHAGRVKHVYLGLNDGAPVFACAAAPSEPASQFDAGAQWRPAFEIAEQLPEVEREMIAVASGLLRWHETSTYAGSDASPTRPTQGGWARTDAAGREFFPRTDPAVIVLIEHDGRVLLGSNALWEAGRFSLLAGFVETGESLEQAVHREVFEESGVCLGTVTYVASQPWPFPRSLMLGFRATLAPGQDPEGFVADPEEISELRWFSRDELLNPPPGIKLPGPVSIARWLLEQWCEEGANERVG